MEFEYYHPDCLRDALNFIFEQNDSAKISICLENLLQMLLLEEPSPSNRFVHFEWNPFFHSNDFLSSRSLQSITWSLIEHFSRLLSADFPRSQLILELFLQLKSPQTQPTYEQTLQLACSLTDVHMKIIDDNEENLFDDLLLWRDTLRNFIQMNNPDFHLFLLITLIDFLVPKFSVNLLDSFRLFNLEEFLLAFR